MGDMADYYMEKDFLYDLMNDGQNDQERHMPLRNEQKLSAAALVTNKFYVGSRRALDKNWGHKKLEAAVAHATELLEESGGQEQFVVQIIRIVKRKESPIIVKTVP